MKCKYCSSDRVVKNGKVKGKQTFLCKECNHRFMNGSDFPRMRTESRIISTSIDLYYDGLSVRNIQAQLEKIFDVSVSQVTIWKWIMKYSELVSDFVMELTPKLTGEWHVDETVIKCKGVHKWFWEIIDEKTRFLVASHLSGDRTISDVIQLFERGMVMAKEKPKTIYVDGLPAYVKGFNKVFYTRYKEQKVELVRKVGLRARKNNNIVERLHGTLKNRTKVTRGLKEEPTVDSLLKGWTVHYNFVRKHQSIGKTPAKASGITIGNNWHTLIKEAMKSKCEEEETLRSAIVREEPIDTEIISPELEVVA